MNFLLHRHLAESELGSSTAGVGAMLPDLWRMADRRGRPARAEIDPPAGAGALGDVCAGVRHHVEADRWFHATAVFLEGERATLARLREANVEAPRLGLFAHVVWEMCLDGALVRRQGLDATLGGLRAAFAACFEPEEDGAAPADRAVDLHHWGRAGRDGEARAAFARRMRRLREEIARGPWIDGYQDGEGLAFRLAGVRSRLGFEPPSPADHERLSRALERLADEARPALEELLREAAAR